MHSNNTTVQNPKNGPASPKGSGAVGKARNLKKRAFSLPYISYNLHYTKYYKNQKQRPPSPAFRHRCRFWEPLLLFYILSFGTCGSPCQADIVKYSWTRLLSCERSLHQTLQRCIQRLCSEVRADRFIVNARHCLTAFFAAKLCNVLFAGHKALFCQNRRTVYIFQ